MMSVANARHCGSPCHNKRGTKANANDIRAELKRNAFPFEDRKGTKGKV
jgi:hypothetical protein